MPSVNVYQTCLVLYVYLKSQRLRLRLNCSLVSVLCKSCGSLFQIVGSHTRKLQQPKWVDCTHGTTRFPWSADRSLKCAATVCTGVYTSPKYLRHRPWEQSNIISAILKLIMTHAYTYAPCLVRGWKTWPTIYICLAMHFNQPTTALWTCTANSSWMASHDVYNI